MPNNDPLPTALSNVLDRAMYHLSQANWHFASELLEQVRKQQPQDSEVIYNLSVCYHELEDPTRALNTLQSLDTQVVRKLNTTVQILFLTLKASCYQKLEQWEEARKLFEKVVKLDGTKVNAWLQLGDTCYQLEDFKSAEKALLKVIKLDPENEVAYYELACTVMCQDRLTEAEKYFDIALEKGLEPGWDVYANQARIFASLGKTERARMAMTKGLALISTPTNEAFLLCEEIIRISTELGFGNIAQQAKEKLEELTSSKQKMRLPITKNTTKGNC